MGWDWKDAKFVVGNRKSGGLLAPTVRAFQFAILIDSIRFVMRLDSNRFV